MRKKSSRNHMLKKAQRVNKRISQQEILFHLQSLKWQKKNQVNRETN